MNAARATNALENHLKHLAALSPHHLSDLGFEQTHADPQSGLEVWEKGTLHVCLDHSGPNEDPVVSIHRQPLIPY